LKIRDLQLPGRVFLAPLAGYTDSAYRRLCRRHGAALVTTEMVSADGLVRGASKTFRYVEFTEEERPLAVQIFGSDPAVMRDAAAVVVGRFDPEIVDINCGCPVRKVVNRNAGSALLADLPLLASVVRAVVEGAGKTPVTVKTRSGWDRVSSEVEEIAGTIEQAGAAAIAVHARTRAEQFTGRADWSVIRRMKEAVSVPVIGNGDVTTPESARRLMDETGCDAIMIGRGAMGNPWIFGRIERYLATGDSGPEPEPSERIAVLLAHLDLALSQGHERSAVREMRKHVACYTRGMPGAAETRREAMGIEGAAGLRALLEAYRERLGGSAPRSRGPEACGAVPGSVAGSVAPPPWTGAP
jgi:tRNA-dihydrouridine synthase B